VEIEDSLDQENPIGLGRHPGRLPVPKVSSTGDHTLDGSSPLTEHVPKVRDSALAEHRNDRDTFDQQ
jgi:hypothetical protein